MRLPPSSIILSTVCPFLRRSSLGSSFMNMAPALLTFVNVAPLKPATEVISSMPPTFESDSLPLSTAFLVRPAATPSGSCMETNRYPTSWFGMKPLGTDLNKCPVHARSPA